MKIFLYARKSTESEERQVQSIEDQLNVMRRRAKDLWYKIIEEFTESKSAKQPGREKFNEMVQRIKQWEVRWVIAWKIDRLSRNPIDTWEIQFMLQNGTLDKVITSDREYFPYDAWLLFSVESWMANQYIIDLKKNVARWMKSKVEKWWFPATAPEWYKNDKNTNTIVIDEINFPLVRRIYDFFMSGNYTVSEVRYLANNEWGYRTRQRKRMWWKPLSCSGIYKILTNVFYTGNFMWSWEEYPWNHTPMVTELEFQRVQNLLGTKWRHRPRTKVFSYTGLIKCWECGCTITAEEKTRHIHTNGKTHHYTYYRCSKRSDWNTCKQSAMRIEELEKQILTILNSIEILPEYKEWALEIIRRDYHLEETRREEKRDNLNKSLREKEKLLNRLTDTLLDQRIDKDDFDRRKKSLKLEIASIEKDIKNMNSRRDEKNDMVEEFFEFVTLTSQRFNKASIHERREIFNALGEKYVLKDWVLAIELYPWIKILKNNMVSMSSDFTRFETYKKSTTKGKDRARDLESRILAVKL